jgi:hypothetical protein
MLANPRFIGYTVNSRMADRASGMRFARLASSMRNLLKKLFVSLAE